MLTAAGERTVVRHEGRDVSGRALLDAVYRHARVLDGLGIGRGDLVAIYAPNHPGASSSVTPRTRGRRHRCTCRRAGGPQRSAPACWSTSCPGSSSSSPAPRRWSPRPTSARRGRRAGARRAGSGSTRRPRPRVRRPRALGRPSRRPRRRRLLGRHHRRAQGQRPRLQRLDGGRAHRAAPTAPARQRQPRLPHADPRRPDPARRRHRGAAGGRRARGDAGGGRGGADHRPVPRGAPALRADGPPRRRAPRPVVAADPDPHRRQRRAVLRRRARERLGPVIAHTYGASEMGIVSALPPAEHDRTIPTGSPAPATSSGRRGPVPATTRRARPGSRADGGALPAMAAGYRHRPVEEAGHFVDGWYRTGDLGRLDDEGYLHVLGRAADCEVVRRRARHPAGCRTPCAGSRTVRYAVVVPELERGRRSSRSSPGRAPRRPGGCRDGGRREHGEQVADSLVVVRRRAGAADRAGQARPGGLRLLGETAGALSRAAVARSGVSAGRGPP